MTRLEYHIILNRQIGMRDFALVPHPVCIRSILFIINVNNIRYAIQNN